MERTLDECVHSVLAVCGDDAQVILVDDGSPDRCPQMCDDWAARDTRIEVVHRANGGLSAARNSGLDVARGEWVTFVDSDDVVGFDFDFDSDFDFDFDSDFGFDFDVDIIEYPVLRHYGEKDETLLQWGSAKYATGEDYWCATQGWTHSYAANKIFRRSLFDGVRFPEGRAFEDIWTIPMLLQKSRGIRTVARGRYGYRDNAEGITMTAGGGQLTDLLEGNIHAVGVMGICTAQHYASMVNIQLDVYRTTGRILLRRQALPLRDILRLPWLLCVKVLLPLRLLCFVHTLIKK